METGSCSTKNSTTTTTINNNNTNKSSSEQENELQLLLLEQSLPIRPDETMSDYIVRRLGRRAGKRGERSNILVTKDIFERMNLTSYISSIPIVHVAGTKGKGSTSAMTAELLRKCHNFNKVALFQSPHLVDVRERVLINNEFIEQSKFLELFKSFEEEYAEKCNSIFDVPPVPSSSSSAPNDNDTTQNTTSQQLQMIEDKTHFFRSIFVFAVFVMKYLAVDAAVIEVGIGGRLDPTNIVPPPACCVVTCLGMDHTDLLGNTIELIAGEKAGIYKKGAGALLSAPQSDYPSTRPVLERCAALEAGQRVVYPAPSDFGSSSRSAFELVAEHKGAHMAENAALALAASRVVAALANADKTKLPPSEMWNSYPLTDSEADVIVNFKLDGRSQKISWTPGSSGSTQNKNNNNNFLVDGAHTVESVRRAVAWALHATPAAEKLTIVFGTSRAPGPQLDEILSLVSKDDQSRLEELIFINIPELASGKDSAAKCVEYMELNKNHTSINYRVATTVEEALAKIHQEITEKNVSGKHFFLVGSMYSAGGALKYLRSNGSCVDL